MKSQSVRQINILDRVLILIRMNEFGDRTRVRRTTRYLEVTEDRRRRGGHAEPVPGGQGQTDAPPAGTNMRSKMVGWLLALPPSSALNSGSLSG